ncbi:MAG TPA: circadian clock protein KaiC [Acidimicrobiales bacterium]|nr:circadian clock protein KaiC [Acidimicrobiales bacterium]
MEPHPGEALERLEVGIPGLDIITRGGLPRGRLSLVAGTAGAGKTVFATQFLASGIRAGGESGVFVTCEERPESIRRNTRSLGWDIGGWESAGRWAFVDASPRNQVDTVFTGDDYGLGPLLARITQAVARVGASRVAIDSVGALVTQFDRVAPARQALFRLADTLHDAGVTTVITAERPEDYGPIAHLGFEEFVADNVIILRNALDGEKRRRTVEVLKMRGGSHRKGEHLFTLLDGEGIVVVPVSVDSIGYGSSEQRLTAGVAELDRMFHGGLFEKSLWLVAGPTGTGKSLLAAQFVAGGVQTGQKALLHSFEESHDQILRNGRNWGVDLAGMEQGGQLRIVAEAPESASLEDHLQRMKATIDEFRPDRVAIDSLTALQRIATVKSFREYVLGLTLHIKWQSLAGMVTSSSKDFLGSETSSELHVSTISDAITLLHYVPAEGELRRGVQVLKMRGSDHDKAVREFHITGRGMEIGEPFDNITHLL